MKRREFITLLGIAAVRMDLRGARAAGRDAGDWLSKRLVGRRRPRISELLSPRPG